MSAEHLTESELRIRVLTDQRDEARRIADQLADDLIYVYAYSGFQDPATDALAAYEARSWR